jgi:DNA-binding response OmpR family regulator
MSEERPAKILIAEDEVYSRRLLEKILSGLGYRVEWALDGAEALAMLDKDPDFDLVISDWVMPHMDGVELCSKIKSREDLRQIYFIVLSSRDMSEDKVNALDRGVDEYLTKPCNPEELKARVRAGLRIRKLQEEILTLERKMAILQLATTAGHEINNPLTGIFGYMELLREGLKTGEPAEELLDYLKKMRDQSIRIRDVVSRLITLEEIQTKKYIGDQDMIDLGLPENPVPHSEE